ncbi:hypothetical protein L1049_004056 [Liquidambar formosana]|uniref:Uncharacterized protein n=1 Tax=Liquidambar formosana TaxID=63359 RepID=A0AAP0RRD0_LIQFO
MFLAGKDGSVDSISNGIWDVAWGNQLLWGYQESMDTDLQRTFNLAVENGITFSIQLILMVLAD